jgi:peptidyl-tRNA hydrolase
MPGTCGLQKVNIILSTFQDFHQFLSTYEYSSNPGEEFSKLLHDTGFEVIDCEYRDGEYSFDTPGYFRGDCGIHKNNLYASHPIVTVIKQTTFVQSNTTHVYSINLIALTYMLHVSAYT